MMIKTLFTFLNLLYLSNSCCVQICNKNGVYFKVCGDDVNLNIDNINCDKMYQNILWEIVTPIKLNYSTYDSVVNNTVNNTLNNTVNNTINNTVNNTLNNTVNNTLNNTVNNTLNNTVNNTINNTNLHPSPSSILLPTSEEFSPSPLYIPSYSPSLSPSPSINNDITNLLEEIALSASPGISPSSFSDDSQYIPKNNIENTDEFNYLYLLLLIIPVLILILGLIYYNYRNKRFKTVIPKNDIEMGDNMSIKTDETVMAEVRNDNPLIEIKKVIEHLIVETEKNN